MTTTTTPRTRSDPVMFELLDRELNFDPVARGGFINHLAMSLIAARRLGATDDELRAWYDGQTSGDFLVPRARPDWLDADSAEIDRVGVHTAVRTAVTDLVQAPSSQFFHAVIRLDLAIDAGHRGQVANALRNWSRHASPLEGPPPDGDGSEPLASVLDQVQTEPARGTTRRRDVTAQTWFRDALAHLHADDRLLDDLAAAAIARHVDPTDFTTLHLVTGVRAVRAIAPLLGETDARRLALHTAQAVANTVAVHIDPAPRDDRGPGVAEVTWERLGRAAIDTGDPHVAKLVYAALLEDEATGDPRYRTAAQRQTGGRSD